MRNKYFGLIIVVLSLMSILVLDSRLSAKLSTSKDKENADAFLNRMRECIQYSSEQSLIDDIELKCELFFFLTGEPKVSVKSLEKLEQKKASSVIVIALHHDEIGKNFDALEALERVNDITIIPNLIEALRRNNYVREGSEDATIHQNYKRRLVTTLAKITRQVFTVKDFDNKKEIEGVIVSAEEWWKNYAREKEEGMQPSKDK